MISEKKIIHSIKRNVRTALISCTQPSGYPEMLEAGQLHWKTTMQEEAGSSYQEVGGS